MRRRDVLKVLTAAAMSGVVPRGLARAAAADDLYDIGRFGNARVLHMTDSHAQLLPVHFREPSVNLGVAGMAGQPPHLVGKAFLKHYGVAPNTARGACLHLSRFHRSRAPLWPARRFRPSQDPGRAPARRGRARQRAAHRRRRSDAGFRARQLRARRRHGRRRQPARHRGDDRALGVHLRRGAPARQHQALQGRVHRPERVPYRRSRLQRQAGVRRRFGPRVQALYREGRRRPSHRRDRASNALRADRASQAIHPGLDLRHP